MVRIHLLRLGAVPSDAVRAIADGIEYLMGVPAITHPCILDPEPAFDADRGQYHATRLLERLETCPHTPDDRLLGLTQVDLFIPILTFVFGEARLNQPIAVLSLRRLCPTFYGLPQNPALMRNRALVETVHELGHTFGLLHCSDYRCAMHASRMADDIDLKGPGFCADCANLLRPHDLAPRITAH